jgi:hypothetical protein
MEGMARATYQNISMLDSEELLTYADFSLAKKLRRKIYAKRSR